jgi:hypothetical protein
MDLRTMIKNRIFAKIILHSPFFKSKFPSPYATESRYAYQNIHH